jgi:PIN domain nuclease of toxin-antitoxin system
VTRTALDSSVVVTWILQEQRWHAVDNLLQRSDVELILPGPALTEVIYIARKKGNASTGAQIATSLRAHGVQVEPTNETDLVRAAELLEASDNNPGPLNPRTKRRGSLSLGDALILAIVERLGCPVLTGDSHWNWMVTQKLLSVKVQTL